ncbi:putative disease resistance protein [Cinnamomum micranthum f. kanehirae]|uniref:Putative disease resistance protein n=1 Tax=Cinnamomum micranthum f. kanehirae TaxID=337451 RepID=A0A443MZW3_9MAGN|nr:putative disease resistance protein [Cinnamomum micranthum f. kanehirae]
MVTLPQNPDLKRIQSDVADPLGLKMPPEEGDISMRACKLSERLCQGKNVLVILDNLWGRLELADVGIPNREECKGCNIIFTTRSTEVCDAMESQVRIAVNVLSEQDSWSLFREKAGGIVDTPTLHDLAWKVAKESGGLPLAIVTLGRALRNKDQLVWKNALLELQRSNPASIKDMNSRVLASLEMSYNYLESEEAKSFFLLCSLFPEGLKEWPEIENLEECKRISIAANNLEMLPADSISCPRLLTLSLDNNCSLRKIPESFFTGMKALRVLDLCTTNISSLPSSMECLENLRTLWLDRCPELKDVAVIGKLKKLEILCLKESGVDKLPKEIGELTNLKLLDLTKTKLEIVPPNVISRLTRLEELYMGYSFNQWEPEEAEDARQASIAEFEFLKHLRVLDVHIKTLSCMPKSSTRGPWKNLMKFRICIGGEYFDRNTERCIKVENISFPIPYSVQSFFDITNELFFARCRGLTNLADRQELRGESLETLTIAKCDEMECVISMEEKAPPLKLKSLEVLCLVCLHNLKTICNGPLAATCLENLRVLCVLVCNNLLSNILPSFLVQVLQNLEELRVYNCQELQEVFNSEGLTEQHAVLTSLRTLELSNLPSLSSIWKGAMPIGSLRNLEVLIVDDCCLRYIFSPTFPQFATRLARLLIKDCEKMENLIMEENFPSQSPAIGFFSKPKAVGYS